MLRPGRHQSMSRLLRTSKLPPSVQLRRGAISPPGAGRSTREPVIIVPFEILFKKKKRTQKFPVIIQHKTDAKNETDVDASSSDFDFSKRDGIEKEFPNSSTRARDVLLTKCSDFGEVFFLFNGRVGGEDAALSSWNRKAVDEEKFLFHSLSLSLSRGPRLATGFNISLNWQKSASFRVPFESNPSQQSQNRATNRKRERERERGCGGTFKQKKKKKIENRVRKELSKNPLPPVKNK